MSTYVREQKYTTAFHGLVYNAPNTYVLQRIHNTSSDPITGLGPLKTTPDHGCELGNLIIQ